MLTLEAPYKQVLIPLIQTGVDRKKYTKLVLIEYANLKKNFAL